MKEKWCYSQRWGVPPSFESNNLPAARLWLEVDKSLLNINNITNNSISTSTDQLHLDLDLHYHSNIYASPQVGKSDLKSAQKNLEAGDFMWAACMARMVRKYNKTFRWDAHIKPYSGNRAFSEKCGVDLQPAANDDNPRHSTGARSASSGLGDHWRPQGCLGICAKHAQGP